MSDSDREQLTHLIKASRQGDKKAKDRLFTVLYDELHRLAAHSRGVGVFGDTMQPTALAHEAYIFFEKRLPIPPKHERENRETFFRTVALAMRAILRDYWRKKRAKKRGGGKPAAPLDDRVAEEKHDSEFEAVDFLALDEAMSRLEHENGRWFGVVMHRFFAGRSREETAQLMGISEDTVKRDWKYARAWLQRELKGENSQ